MSARYTVKAPVLSSEDVAYLHAYICEAVDIVTPARNNIVRAKTVDALYIETLQSSTKRKSTVQVGDYIVYTSTADRVGPHVTMRYRCTRVMRVAHIGPRMLISAGGQRARHDDVLAIVRD